jgi:hypothetical protein
MNFRLALGTGLCVFAAVSAANAQEVTVGYQGLPYKASGESSTGIQVSDSALLHVGAGAEAGYDTNVFYQETGAISSPILRSSLFADIGNATRTGSTGQLAFGLRAGVTYRRYQGDDPALEPFRNAWMPTAGLTLSYGAGQVGFGFADTFARMEDPPYGISRIPVTRYNNQASIEGRWSPGGGRLAGVLRYTNMIDVFEGTYRYATSDTNLLMLDAAWKWLPKTAIFVNAQQGYVFYLEDAATLNNKSSSFPLTLSTGLRGLLSEKTAVVLALGYANGFYSNGASTGGFLGSSYAELSLTYRPTLLSRIIAGFKHDFSNAIIASFSYNETAYLSYVQQIAGRFALDLSGRYQHRTYGGSFVDPMQVGRVDDFVLVGATFDYFMRNWVYAGLGYSAVFNDSNLPDLNYVKQQVFVRLGITY